MDVYHPKMLKNWEREKKYLYADKIAKTNFINIIVDCYFVEKKFDVDEVGKSITGDSIITIYRTNIDTRTLLSKFKLMFLESDELSGYNKVLLTPTATKDCYMTKGQSYLIAMNVADFF